MRRLQETIRNHVAEDHLRGCNSRHTSCECGYEMKGERLLRQAANRIEDLEKELERYRNPLDEQNG